MKRPLLGVALLYVTGVALADVFVLPLPVLLAGSLLLVLCCLIPSRARPVWLGFLLIATGAANLALHTAIVSPHDLRLLIGERIEDVTLRGTLQRTPSPKLHKHGDEISSRTVAELEATSLRLHTSEADWQPAFGRITISTAGTLSPLFFAGQKVEVAGRLRMPQAAVADGLFDYRKYLRRRATYYQLQVASTADWKLNEADRVLFGPVSDRFIAWGKTALARGLPVEDESLRLEWALTLGWKPALTEEVSESFIRAATYHIFAVDGLRIAIISSIFLSLFRVVGLSRGLSGVLLLPLLWSYACLTGFPASAIRAAVMATVVIGGWALKRPPEIFNSLFAAALVILVWEPAQLFQAGFQLSFFVVLCIILLMPVLERYGERLFRVDPWLPPLFRPFWQRILSADPMPSVGRHVRAPVQPLWERVLRVFWRSVWATGLVSLAAWLGSIPLTAYYFNIFTPVSVPANLFAVPLCGLVLLCNLISLLLAGWFPWAAEFYNHAGWFWMECIRRTSQWSAACPAAYFYVPAPSLSTTGLYYLLLLALATGWVLKIRHRSWALTGLGCLTGLWCLQWTLQSQTTRLTILPLKGAAAMFVDAPGLKNDLLIDCGSESSAEFTLKPFLQAQGVNHLPSLLLTHGEVSHVGGAELVQRNFAPSQVDLSPVPFRSAVCRKVRSELEAIPGLTRVIQRSDQVGYWQVLHPTREDHFPQADDNAVVLQGEINGTRVLLLSDLGKPGQNALFGRQQDLRAEIVVAGLPQQTEPLAEALLDAIQPRLIIITDADYPAAARASRKLRERLDQRTIPVIYTAQAGAVTLSFHRNGWQVKTMNPPRQAAKPSVEADPIEDESR